MSERNRTDKELIDGYRNGCLSDFELLVGRYQDQIYNYVFSLVRDQGRRVQGRRQIHPVRHAYRP